MPYTTAQTIERKCPFDSAEDIFLDFSFNPQKNTLDENKNQRFFMHFQLKLWQIKRSDQALRWKTKDRGRNSTGMWRHGGAWQEEKGKRAGGTLF